MNSRMERYKEFDEAETITRSERNRDLYENMGNGDLRRTNTNNNFRVIENSGKDIDIEKIKKYITSMNDKTERKLERENIFQIDNSSDNSVSKEEVVRDYDLNSVLEKARRGREINYEKERYKKVHNTQYDILSQLKMYEEDESKEEVLDDFNTNERTLIDLINTVTIHKDDMGLLDELKGGNENTLVMEPMKSETLTYDFKDELMKEIKAGERQNRVNESFEPSNKVNDNLSTQKFVNNKEIYNDSNKEKDKENLEKTQELVNLKEKNEIDKSFYTNSMTFSKEDFEGFEELEKTVKKNNVMLVIGIVFVIILIIVTLVIIAKYVFG